MENMLTGEKLHGQHTPPGEKESAAAILSELIFFMTLKIVKHFAHEK
jgi:hypothetical protein